MSAQSDELAATAARDFARAVSAYWEARLGVELLGVYLIGSLAHGGFSRRYSDIDVALVTEAGISPVVLDALRTEAAKLSADLAAKLSVFWTDRGFAVGHGVEPRFDPELMYIPDDGMVRLRLSSRLLITMELRPKISVES